jgi:C-terminal processing protease CtpA/Prc
VELNQSNGVRLRYLDELVIVQTPLQGTIIEKDIDKPREVIMQISGKDFSVMVESAYKVRAEGKEILDEYVIFLKDK